MTTASPLRIQGLGVRYPGRKGPVLSGLDLEVQAGERVGVIGRTGAGKSTIGLAAMGYGRGGRRIADGRGTTTLGVDPGDLTGCTVERAEDMLGALAQLSDGGFDAVIAAL